MNRLFGNSGVRLSKWVFSFALSGSSRVHALDLEQREKFFLFLRRPDLAGDQIAGLQIEPADLRRRNVNVLRAGQIIEALRTQKAETFRQHFEHALGKQHARAFGVFLEDVENHLVLAHRAEILHAEILGHVVQLAHLHRLELGDVQRGDDLVALRAAALFHPGFLHFGLFGQFDRRGGRLQGGGTGRFGRNGGFDRAVGQFRRFHGGSFRRRFFRRNLFHRDFHRGFRRGFYLGDRRRFHFGFSG